MYLGLEKVSKFKTFEGFFKLNEREFELFKKNYKFEKSFYFGNKKIMELKDFEKLKKEKKIVDFFEDEAEYKLREKLKEVELEKIKIEEETKTETETDIKEIKNNDKLKKKEKISKAEIVQWKTVQAKKYLERKTRVLKRLDNQFEKIKDTLSKLSENVLQLSDIFKELDLQETAMDYKISAGLNWRKQWEADKNEIKLGNKQHSENAWQFGVDMCKQWSIYTKLQETILKEEMIKGVKLMKEGDTNLLEKVFCTQEQINTEFIYEMKKFNLKKKEIIRKKKIEELPITDEFKNNKEFIELLKKEDKLCSKMIMKEKTDSLYHMGLYFENSNNLSFLQMQNIRMFFNSLFDKKFDRWKDILKLHANLLFEF